MAPPAKPRNRMNAQSKANAEAAKAAELHKVPNSNNSVMATVVGETGKKAPIVNGSGEPIIYKNPLTAKRSLQNHNPGLPVKLAPEI